MKTDGHGLGFRSHIRVIRVIRSLSPVFQPCFRPIFVYFAFFVGSSPVLSCFRLFSGRGTPSQPRMNTDYQNSGHVERSRDISAFPPAHALVKPRSLDSLGMTAFRRMLDPICDHLRSSSPVCAEIPFPACLPTPYSTNILSSDKNLCEMSARASSRE